MEKTILLMGTPNVGKSAIFNQLTGLNVSVANYCGTTVDYTRGIMSINGDKYELIDVPGTYSLCATCEAEEVAVEMVCGNCPSRCHRHRKSSHCSTDGGLEGPPEFEKPSAILYVLDAGNFEGGLFLLLQLMELDLPIVVALNRRDLALAKGCHIDIESFSDILQLPVIPTIAINGEGINDVKTLLEGIVKGKIEKQKPSKLEANWKNVESITEKVFCKKETKKNLRKEKWDRWFTSPWPGLPLAMLILCLVFALVIGLGMGLRQYLLLPLFRGLIIPPIVNFITQIIPAGTLQNIFIGEYGFLIKGLEWPFTLVLPYVLSFYAVLSIVEDSGYMPRLAILLDGLFQRIGLNGSGIIPLLIGYGCGIPAIMATRAMGTRKERLIITTLVCLAIPCISQTGAFIALLASRSIGAMIAVFIFSWVVMVIAGLILNKWIKGKQLETLLEIPDLLLPRARMVGKKLWLKLKLYIADGALPMIGVVGLAAILYETGIMNAWANAISPLVTGWLRLPQEAATPLALGILRRELSVLPLLDMNLTALQLFTGAIVGLFYVPCIAIVATVAKEFKVPIALGILGITTFIAFLLGGLIARVGSLFF